MAKTEKILRDYGLTTNMLCQLHKFDLLDALLEIDGIGERRLEDIQDYLSDLGAATLPPGNTWQYRLALDLLKIPLDPAKLCFSDGSQPSVLNQLAAIERSKSVRFGSWLNKALSSLEHNVITLQYRNRLSFQEIADKLNLPKATISTAKARAFQHLRTKQNLQTLRELIFDNPATTP